MRTIVAALLLLLAIDARAWTPRTWERGELVENPRYTSANGRFTVVVRQYERVPDFETLPAEIAFGWDEPRPSVPRSEMIALALYDARRLVSVAEIDYLPSDILVAESGAFHVVAGSRARTDLPLLTLVSARGTIVSTLRFSDVFSEEDLREIERDARVTIRIAEDIPRIVVPVGNGREEEIRIDPASGDILDRHKRDLLPVWRIWAAQVPEHLRPAHAPLPLYPKAAWKTRIAGTFVAEVLVSARGEVVEVSATGPFGIDHAIENALRQWWFEPPPEPVRARITFRAALIPRSEWAAISTARR